jgi:hypothetical protein
MLMYGLGTPTCMPRFSRCRVLWFTLGGASLCTATIPSSGHSHHRQRHKLTSFWFDALQEDVVYRYPALFRHSHYKKKNSLVAQVYADGFESTDILVWQWSARAQLEFNEVQEIVQHNALSKCLSLVIVFSAVPLRLRCHGSQKQKFSISMSY